MSDSLSPVSEQHGRPARHPIRRGALLGGLVGLSVGLVALIVSVGLGAAGGAAIARLTQLRLAKGSAPRLYFLHKEEAGAPEAVRLAA